MQEITLYTGECSNDEAVTTPLRRIVLETDFAPTGSIVLSPADFARLDPFLEDRDQEFIGLEDGNRASMARLNGIAIVPNEDVEEGFAWLRQS